MAARVSSSTAAVIRRIDREIARSHKALARDRRMHKVSEREEGERGMRRPLRRSYVRARGSH